MLMRMWLKQIHFHWPQVSPRKRVSVCSQADHPTKQIAGWKASGKRSVRRVKVACPHAVFTCHTAARPFVQTPSPSHKAGIFAVVTCDQMNHMLLCMGVRGLHTPCTFNTALTKALPGDWVAIDGNKGDLTESANPINCNTQPEPLCSSASREHFPSKSQQWLRLSFNFSNMP
ncbi:hypothetical protein O181_095339 [Austropuccinia psidii MF-1]|uniref:Uncharacterized protein n=1 Tax=Austropuccinia psidii MF-1 TaxID=1389203 RepID=A0A9Q3J546_9BASI|nr:hypothetical protein [Austropuccinia psidii MF-1]